MEIKWIECKLKKPEFTGQYRVYGLFNKGTIHEIKRQYYANWDNDFGWVDRDGEDLTGMNESITHYIDPRSISDPIICEKHEWCSDYSSGKGKHYCLKCKALNPKYHD